MITAADEDATRQVPADAWKPGTCQDGTIEEDKDVAEITGLMSAPHGRGRPESRLAEGNGREGRDRVVGEPAPAGTARRPRWQRGSPGA
jgi:hypothetical protein